MSFVDVVFHGNTTDNQGGALRLRGATVSVTDALFSDNAAADDGGAIAMSDDTVLTVLRELTEAGVREQYRFIEPKAAELEAFAVHGSLDE